QIETGQSVQVSERRYRMLAESLNDVIFTTNSDLAINYISPSVQTMLGYSPSWAAANGLDSLVMQSRQVSMFYGLIRTMRRRASDVAQVDLLRREAPVQVMHVDCRAADGRHVSIELRIMLIWNEQNRFGGILC